MCIQKVLSAFSFLSCKKKKNIKVHFARRATEGNMSNLIYYQSIKNNPLIRGQSYSIVISLGNPARRPSKVGQIDENRSFITGQSSSGRLVLYYNNNIESQIYKTLRNLVNNLLVCNQVSDNSHKIFLPKCVAINPLIMTTTFCD